MIYLMFPCGKPDITDRFSENFAGTDFRDKSTEKRKKEKNAQQPLSGTRSLYSK